MGFDSPYIGLALGGIGTGISAATAYNDAKSENLARQYEAKLLQEQAALSEIQAQNALQRGEVKAGLAKKQADALRGEQRMAYASSGVNANTGSAAAMQAETAAWGQYAQSEERYNASMESWGHRVNARTNRLQSNLTLAGKRNPVVATASPLIGGMTGMYDVFSRWNKK